ncbi:universal stress protein [Salinigranum salinum]|uniref:universal stress protein n=1 Tax=Salinigranum salinum TaxID=1364937 RepID=UPI001260D04B|nr:universal stress protein [Salinigranum salinum]
MVDRVLVPMDGSEMSLRALEYALDVHAGADITVLFVAGEPSPMMGRALQLALETDVQQAAEELAEEVFERAHDRAAGQGVEIDTEVALGNPARQIVDRAADFDAIVIGSHGGTLRETLFMGNVARTVSSRAPVPVTIVR